MIDDDGRIFVHQCPVCHDWQVDYTEQVYISVAQFRYNADFQLIPDLTPCQAMVEQVVAEHYREAHHSDYTAFLASIR